MGHRELAEESKPGSDPLGTKTGTMGASLDAKQSSISY